MKYRFYGSFLDNESVDVLCDDGSKEEVKEKYKRAINENIIESIQEGFIKMWGKTLIVKLETPPFIPSRIILLDNRNVLDFYSVIENIDPEWAAIIFSIWFGKSEEEI